MSAEKSTKPYLIRALHEWCTDNGYTPYLVVAVRDDYTQVPIEYVKDNEIILNIAFDATKNLVMKNDFISFFARFAGVSREIFIPIGAVVSIFSQETGDGMGFEYEEATNNDERIGGPSTTRSKLSVVTESELSLSEDDEDNEPNPDKPSSSHRPKLRLVK